MQTLFSSTPLGVTSLPSTCKTTQVVYQEFLHTPWVHQMRFHQGHMSYVKKDPLIFWCLAQESWYFPRSIPFHISLIFGMLCPPLWRLKFFIQLLIYFFLCFYNISKISSLIICSITEDILLKNVMKVLYYLQPFLSCFLLRLSAPPSWILLYSVFAFLYFWKRCLALVPFISSLKYICILYLSDSCCWGRTITLFSNALSLLPFINIFTADFTNFL